MSVVDQHFIFHCCNNCRTVFLFVITDDTEVQRAQVTQLTSRRAEIHTWFWLRCKVLYYAFRWILWWTCLHWANPALNNQRWYPAHREVSRSQPGAKAQWQWCQAVSWLWWGSFCHCFILSSFSWVCMAWLYSTYFPPLGSAPSSLPIAPVICAAQLAPSDSSCCYWSVSPFCPPFQLPLCLFIPYYTFVWAVLIVSSVSCIVSRRADFWRWWNGGIVCYPSNHNSDLQILCQAISPSMCLCVYINRGILSLVASYSP